MPLLMCHLWHFPGLHDLCVLNKFSQQREASQESPSKGLFKGLATPDLIDLLLSTLLEGLSMNDSR